MTAPDHMAKPLENTLRERGLYMRQTPLSRERASRACDTRFLPLEAFECRPLPDAATFHGPWPASETLHRSGLSQKSVNPTILGSPASDAIRRNQLVGGCVSVLKKNRSISRDASGPC
jgi:hypothetical protein